MDIINRDTTILRLGAVPQARGAVCCINEIGSMDYEDQRFLLEVMEEGSFTVDKYAIHLKVKSATTIIATANPTGMKWNDPLKISNAEIPVLGTLLDRFDQIYAVHEFASLLASNRILDSLFRIAKAQARLHFSDVVNEEIVTEIMKDYMQRMMQYGQIVSIIESPRNITYREILSIIKATKSPIELTEAARTASQKDEQIKNYLGIRLNVKNN